MVLCGSVLTLYCVLCCDVVSVFDRVCACERAVSTPLNRHNTQRADVVCKGSKRTRSRTVTRLRTKIWAPEGPGDDDVRSPGTCAAKPFFSPIFQPSGLVRLRAALQERTEREVYVALPMGKGGPKRLRRCASADDFDHPSTRSAMFARHSNGSMHHVPRPMLSACSSPVPVGTRLAGIEESMMIAQN